jgi:23S rRNA (cytosine1962-C5)-methyltransferase
VRASRLADRTRWRDASRTGDNPAARLLPELRLRHASPMSVVVLAAGRERSLVRRHPWIFTGAIAQVKGAPAPGDTVDVRAADGTWLARGTYSPRSQIAVRVWSFDPDQPIDAGLVRDRVAAAIARRRALLDLTSITGHRIVHAESDGLPGVVVDRYGDWLVCQMSTAGAERWKAEITAALAELWPCAGVFERSDVDARKKEGLGPVTGVLAGAPPPGGADGPDGIDVDERGLRFLVDVRRGHKTGFYLDQRDSRSAVRAHAAGRTVLDCFAYTGGFGLSALIGGAAHVTQVDASAPALAQAARNAAHNRLDLARLEQVTDDVFQLLRRYRDGGRRFELIVLDPPKFADTRGMVQRAARGYKDINLLAFKLLAPGGLLFTFSCSGAIDAPLFQKIVADAALDAGRDAQIVGHLSQPADHPVALSFPEAAYLKGLVCRAD